MHQQQLGRINSLKPAFNSNAARIIGTHMPSANPGPGTYTPIVNNYKLKSVKRKRKNFLQGFDWIVSQPRIKGLEVYQNNKNVGPDTYEVQIASKSPKFSWGKSNRFDENLEKEVHMGPGYYDLEDRKQTSGALAVFRSKVPKHIEDNAQNSLSSKKKTNNQLLGSIIQRVDPTMVHQIKASSKPEKSSVFASRVPRFQIKNQSPTTNNIGPGSYSLEIDEIKIKRNSPKPIEPPKNSTQSNARQSQILGPGSYDLNNYSISKQLDKKGYALAKETRFNFKNKKANSTILPGPGQYMEKKYIYADRDQLFKDYLHQNRKSKSISHAILKDKQEKIGSGKSSPEFYDVKVFDMSYELQKKKWFYQNLKELKVELAPFDSKVNRLT